MLAYFPKNEWKNIIKAEKDNKEGKKFYNYYSAIYKDNFLKKNQESKKIFYDKNIKKKSLGAKKPHKTFQDVQDEKDFKNIKMSKDELVLLTMNN